MELPGTLDSLDYSLRCRQVESAALRDSIYLETSPEMGVVCFAESDGAWERSFSSDTGLLTRSRYLPSQVSTLFHYYKISGTRCSSYNVVNVTFTRACLPAAFSCCKSPQMKTSQKPHGQLRNGFCQHTEMSAPRTMSASTASTTRTSSSSTTSTTTKTRVCAGE